MAGGLTCALGLKSMTRSEWLALMKFPTEWSEWELLPEELLAAQIQGYEPGHENATEHDRHGAFQWWLKREPPEAVLVQLAQLSWLDPDPSMGGYVRECIAKARAFSPAVAQALRG